MAKFKGKGVVIAGLIAGAASFFRKKENRDKVQAYLNVAKDKINENGGVQGLMQKAQSKMTGNNSTTQNNTNDNMDKVQPESVEESFQEVAKTAAYPTETVIDGNEMLAEGGGQTVINEYNKEQENRDFK